MLPIINIKQENEALVSHSGLLHVGSLLESMQFQQRLNNLPVHCVDPVFPHGDVLSCMVGLICIGKPDYDAIEIFRNNQFFSQALRVVGCPSSPTLRQRIDLIGETANGAIKEVSAAMIKQYAPMISPISTGSGDLTPLDIDVSPFDNSKTQKEGVSRTYKGYDGYSPVIAYMGREGYQLNVELRNGSQHCQKNTPAFLEQTLIYARKITDAPLLVRLDSGNDSHDNYVMLNKFQDVYFIVKRNLRKESPYAWLNLAENTDGSICKHYGHKTVWIGKTTVGLKGEALPYIIVFKVSKRYEYKGEALLFPEIEVETYTCLLPKIDPHEVIELYHDHGTSEQFHSEIKTDIGLERLPSKYFASNSLVLHLGLLAYNALRIIGQTSLEVQEPGILPANRRKKVNRRRLRTVMQDYIYMAGRMITTGGRWFLSFGKLNPFAGFAEEILQRLRYSPG